MSSENTALSDALVMTVAQYYHGFTKFLSLDDVADCNDTSPKRKATKLKMSAMSTQNFLDMTSDVFDEMNRRIHNQAYPIDRIEYLEQLPSHSAGKNYSRKELSRIPLSGFNRLCTDLLLLIESHFPNIDKAPCAVIGLMDTNLPKESKESDSLQDTLLDDEITTTLQSHPRKCSISTAFIARSPSYEDHEAPIILQNAPNSNHSSMNGAIERYPTPFSMSRSDSQNPSMESLERLMSSLDTINPPDAVSFNNSSVRSLDIPNLESTLQHQLVAIKKTNELHIFDSAKILDLETSLQQVLIESDLAKQHSILALETLKVDQGAEIERLIRALGSSKNDNDDLILMNSKLNGSLLMLQARMKEVELDNVTFTQQCISSEARNSILTTELCQADESFANLRRWFDQVELENTTLKIEKDAVANAMTSIAKEFSEITADINILNEGSHTATNVAAINCDQNAEMADTIISESHQSENMDADIQSFIIKSNDTLGFEQPFENNSQTSDDSFDFEDAKAEFLDCLPNDDIDAIIFSLQTLENVCRTILLDADTPNHPIDMEDLNYINSVKENCNAGLQDLLIATNTYISESPKSIAKVQVSVATLASCIGVLNTYTRSKEANDSTLIYDSSTSLQTAMDIPRCLSPEPASPMQLSISSSPPPPKDLLESYKAALDRLLISVRRGQNASSALNQLLPECRKLSDSIDHYIATEASLSLKAHYPLNTFASCLEGLVNSAMTYNSQRDIDSLAGENVEQTAIQLTNYIMDTVDALDQTKSNDLGTMEPQRTEAVGPDIVKDYSNCLARLLNCAENPDTTSVLGPMKELVHCFRSITQAKHELEESIQYPHYFSRACGDVTRRLGALTEAVKSHVLHPLVPESLELLKGPSMQLTDCVFEFVRQVNSVARNGGPVVIGDDLVDAYESSLKAMLSAISGETKKNVLVAFKEVIIVCRAITEKVENVDSFDDLEHAKDLYSESLSDLAECLKSKSRGMDLYSESQAVELSGKVSQSLYHLVDLVNSSFSMTRQSSNLPKVYRDIDPEKVEDFHLNLQKLLDYAENIDKKNIAIASKRLLRICKSIWLDCRENVDYVPHIEHYESLIADFQSELPRLLDAIKNYLESTIVLQLADTLTNALFALVDFNPQDEAPLLGSRIDKVVLSIQQLLKVVKYSSRNFEVDLHDAVTNVGIGVDGIRDVVFQIYRGDQLDIELEETINGLGECVASLGKIYEDYDGLCDTDVQGVKQKITHHCFILATHVKSLVYHQESVFDAK